jgi:hypothetical protein
LCVYESSNGVSIETLMGLSFFLSLRSLPAAKFAVEIDGSGQEYGQKQGANRDTGISDHLDGNGFHDSSY